MILSKKKPDTYLGSNVSFKGQVFITGLLSVNGGFEGKIEGDSVLVGNESVVMAEINVKKLHIQGSIRGNVTCEEFAFLDDSANFVGELTTLNLKVNVGAKVDAKLRSHNENPS